MRGHSSNTLRRMAVGARRRHEARGNAHHFCQFPSAPGPGAGNLPANDRRVRTLFCTRKGALAERGWRRGRSPPELARGRGGRAPIGVVDGLAFEAPAVDPHGQQCQAGAGRESLRPDDHDDGKPHRLDGSLGEMTAVRRRLRTGPFAKGALLIILFRFRVPYTATSAALTRSRRSFNSSSSLLKNSDAGRQKREQNGIQTSL
jgi:hypothetical protein